MFVDLEWDLQKCVFFIITDEDFISRNVSVMIVIKE